MAGLNVVKRSGGTEPFDERKVYASVYLTCLTHSDHDQYECEDIAETVSEYVAAQVEDREEVLSVEIRMWGRNRLRDIDEQLAEAYYTHHVEK